jgi:hypothetical protein
MSAVPQESQTQEAQKPSDKELNFRKQEEMFKRQLEQERQARQQAEEKAAQLERLAQDRSKSREDEDDPSDEPYVDHRRLEKKLSKFEARMEQKIDQKAEEKARKMVEGERQTNWLKSNPDFYEVMNHAQAFAERDPELAETILSMPEGFERQKLVYKNIKALGLHKPAEKAPSIQEKIDQNRRSPYYQPSGVSSPGYGMASGGKEYSPIEGQNAYKKMQELKGRLRI